MGFPSPTPGECARLMGYPDDFVIPVSDTQAYRQFGNSVVVPVIEHLGGALLRQVARAKFVTTSNSRSYVDLAQAKSGPRWLDSWPRGLSKWPTHS